MSQTNVAGVISFEKMSISIQGHWQFLSGDEDLGSYNNYITNL